MTKPAEIQSREPWWREPPKEGQDPLDCAWGYLVVYADGSVEFDESVRPSDEEILNRKGCRLSRSELTFG